MGKRITSLPRRALASGAYGVLAAVVLGWLDLIPAVDQSIDAAGPAGQLGVAIALGGICLAAVVCWVAAAWYALSIGRRGLAVVLALTNFVGGLFFYFGYVVWRSDA